MSDRISSNLEAGLTAKCFPEQYLVTNQTALADWFDEFDGLGVELDGMDHRSIDALAKALGWFRDYAESADDGQEALTVYVTDTHVLISASVDGTLQVIPADEWDEWQARCPEWREGNGEPEDDDE